MKGEDAHKRGEIKVVGEKGNIFYIKIRQLKANQLNFSVILVYEMKETTREFQLRRYNGKSHPHTNQLEGDRFRDFHIHIATERYQDADYYEDAYAEVSSQYSDLSGALKCLLVDCNFALPPNDPRMLL